MKNRLSFLIIMFFCCWGAFVYPETGKKSIENKRFSRELAVIDYFNNYRNVPMGRSSSYLFNKLLHELKNRKQAFALESQTIFNPENKTQRELYKRIYIPAGAHSFSEKMYQGMADYVENGGLLITDSAMVYVDGNSDDDGKNDKLSPLSETLVTGIKGRQSGKINQIKSVVECPLTRGLKNKTWQDIVKDVFVRRYIKASNAKVLVLCQEVDQTGALSGAPKPFLCFRHEGRGACVFLAGRMDTNAFKSKLISQIFDNLFDKKTLDWLCLQK